MTQRQPHLLAEQFQFRPSSRELAFLEFIQFLHLENALHFSEKWEKVENLFGHEAAAALRDILNNYEDWYFLYGQELEKR
jgi:hypothetical protein